MPRSFPFSPLAAALAVAVTTPAFAEPSAGMLDAKNLDKVEVHGQRVEEPESPKFTQPLLETPQSITIVPAELMQQQGVTTLRDALRNVPGISMQAGEGGVPAGDNLSLRGFSARTDLFVDGVRDFGGYTRDPFNLEQIEVVKGPGSTHSGRGSTGGSINLVSKVARAGDFDHATVAVGDNGLRRATADLNHAIGDSAAFRVNLLAHEDEVNGRDFVSNERWGVAPSLTFGLGGDTVTSLSLFHLEQDNVPDYGLPWVPATNNALVEFRDRPAPIDPATWYGVLDRDYEKTSTDIATLEVTHALSDDVQLRNLTRWGRNERDSVITAPRFASNATTEIRLDAKTRDMEDTILANVTDLTVGFEAGGMRHDLVAGFEIAREESRNVPRTELNPPITTLVNPANAAPYTGTLTAQPPVRAEADSIAAYLFDTVELAPKWELSGGLRWDRFEVDYANGASPTLSNTDTMLSGRIGAVYKPTDTGSVYAAYGTSFNPSAEGLTLNANLAEIDPEESRTFEVGTKWQLMGDRLLLSAALFRTEKTNARVDDPNEAGTLYVLEGEQRVDGFELTAAGRVTDDWTINAGYAFLDSEIERSLNTAELGKELSNTPRQSATLWTTYALTDALEFGLGAQHVGSRFSNNTNTRRAKSYTLYDAMVGYRFSPAFALRLNAHNLTNKAYIDRVAGGHYVPGAERTLLLSADISF